MPVRSEDGYSLALAFAEELPEEVRQRLQVAAAPSRLEFRVVAHGMPELEEVADRVSQDWSMWDNRGAELASWGPDWDSNKVSIALVEYKPVIARAIEVHYGSDLVQVETEEQRPMPARSEKTGC